MFGAVPIWRSIAVSRIACKSNAQQSIFGTAHWKCLVFSANTSTRYYHWVHKEGEDGYDTTRIEEKFNSISKGGSIDLSVDGDIAVVTLNNPSNRNAFTGSMLVQLQDVTKRLWEWKDGKAVILHGSDNFFSSGLDLSLGKQIIEPKDGKDMCMYMQNTLTLFQMLPMFTVAAIQGAAIGGGAEVTTAADFRLMLPGSRIQFVHKKMGIIPGWGGFTRLRRIVGARKAMHLVASCEALDCKSALLIGLADAVASDDKESTVTSIAKEWLEKTYRLSGTDVSVFRAMKKAANDFHEQSRAENELSAIDLQLKREKAVFMSVWGQPVNRAALKNQI